MPKQYGLLFPKDPPPSSWALMRCNHPDIPASSQWHCALYHLDTFFQPKWTCTMHFMTAEAHEFFGQAMMTELDTIGPNDFLYFAPGGARPLSVAHYPEEGKPVKW